MEKPETNITPQDIIDKEFRVKFRGFDIGEVDAFLEEVAESFFRLNEENTLLNEKVLALQQELENIGTSGQVELPAELGNSLEDLKQDTAAISAGLAALKQDRQMFHHIETKLDKIVASVQESGAAMAERSQVEFPADLAEQLKEFTLNATAVAAELAALRDDHLAFDSFRKSFGEIIDEARKAAASISSGNQMELPVDLKKILEDFRHLNETAGAELAALKEEVAGFSGIKDKINEEIREQLSSHFKKLEAKFTTAAGKETPAFSPARAATAAPETKETLLTAKIIEQPEGRKEESTLPDFRTDTEPATEGDLEFLSEDDILDVDKLRGIFQSVLDGEPDEDHVSREGDEAAADLLFLEDDLIEDGPEPEVTFSLEEHEPDTKENFRKK